MKKIRHIICGVLFALIFILPACAAKNIPRHTSAVIFGAGAHPGRAEYSDVPGFMALMGVRGMKTMRFDISPQIDSDVPPGTGSIPASTWLPQVITGAATNGITLHPILQIPLFATAAPTNKSDSGTYTNDDAGAYQQGYHRVHDFVNTYSGAPYNILDWEIGNELNLKTSVKSGDGHLSTDYATANAATYASALKGMSDAIAAIRTATGRSIRIVVDTEGDDFGWIPYLTGQGVTIDKVGYHAYDIRLTDMTNWAASYANINLFTSMASWGKPVIISEFNCAEIYTPATYTDSHCELSIARHAYQIMNQTSVTIEGLEFYEWYDEPAQASPEDKFGIMHDASTEKDVLSLEAKTFAGLALSPSEYTSYKAAAAGWQMNP